jgi:hypothetical protein
MSECPYNNFKNKIFKFINLLREPKKEYGGMPACPFVGAEVDKDKLMIALFDPKECSILEKVEEFTKSNYDSALFVQVSDGDIPFEVTKQYQNFINKLLRENGHGNLKCICFNPNDDLDIEGFNVRSHSPYFLINIAERSVLHQSQKKLINTKYFKKMDEKYLNYLKVKLNKEG